MVSPSCHDMEKIMIIFWTIELPCSHKKKKKKKEKKNEYDSLLKSCDNNS